MKVAIAGFGLTEGVSALDYWLKKGSDVTVLDENKVDESKIPEGVEVRVDDKVFKDLSEFDLVVRTPSLNPSELESAKQVTSVTQEFFEKCPASIIGITGTKGKGTTSSLLAEMFKNDNKTVHLLGNIGISALDQLEHIQTDDIVVYELSSFQLWDLSHSPETSIVLMIEPEHLDVHTSMDDYLAAKSNIAAHQDANGLVIYHPRNNYSSQVANHGNGRKIKYMSPEGAYIGGGLVGIDQQDVIKLEDVKLLGDHNLENICAALSAFWQYSQNKDAAAKAIKEFSGLEHRLELVREKDGVSFYNDSFSTTPSTAIAAIRSFDQPKVLIMGGSDKGSDYSPIGPAVAEANFRSIFLIGDMANNIKKVILDSGYKGEIVEDLGNMGLIVAKAEEVAQEGDVVLLSPACASFDMFKNYKDRGQQFRDSVNNL